MRHRVHWTRLAAAIALAAYIPACAGYTTLADPAAALQPSPKPIKLARITLKTGERFELSRPQVEGDSLRGIPSQGPVRSVALSDVAKVESRKTDAVKTVALVLGITAVAGIVLGAIAAASYSASSCDLSGIEYTGGL